MRVMRGGHFWQFGSIASLATETTDGVILVAFLAQTWPRSDLRVPNFKNFPGGACFQITLASSHFTTRNGRTSQNSWRRPCIAISGVREFTSCRSSKLFCQP